MHFCSLIHMGSLGKGWCLSLKLFSTAQRSFPANGYFGVSTALELGAGWALAPLAHRWRADIFVTEKYFILCGV